MGEVLEILKVLGMPGSVAQWAQCLPGIQQTLDLLATRDPTTKALQTWVNSLFDRTTWVGHLNAQIDDWIHIKSSHEYQNPQGPNPTLSNLFLCHTLKCAFLSVASSRSLKVLRTSSSSEWPSEPSKGNSLDSDECSLSSGTQSSGCPVAENRQDCKSTVPERDPPESLAEFPDGLIKESDILSDDDEDFHQPLKQGSPTKDIELQFQRLRISEEPDMQQPATGPGEQPRLVRGHFCPIKRKANSTKRGRGTLLKTQTRHQSLDSHPEAASLDLNLVLEREFSVQSLTSVVNEECFYEAQSHGKS